MRIELKVYPSFEPILEETTGDVVTVILYRIDSIEYYECEDGSVISAVNCAGIFYYSPLSPHEIDMLITRNSQHI